MVDKVHNSDVTNSAVFIWQGGVFWLFFFLLLQSQSIDCRIWSNLLTYLLVTGASTEM